MNPDKLFDYLDGRLTPGDREQLEEKLMSDAQLRRQFNIARDIHRSGPDRREVVVPDGDPAVAEHGGRLGRRIATAAIVLVFLNVATGLAVITWKRKKPTANPRETEIRQQLAASLGAAAQNAMPPPSFSAGEIQITAARADWENVAGRIITASENFGGSAVKGLPDEQATTVVVDIPSEREAEFRQAVTAAAAIAPVPVIASGQAGQAPKSNQRTIIQVHIAEAAR